MQKSLLAQHLNSVFLAFKYNTPLKLNVNNWIQFQMETNNTVEPNDFKNSKIGKIQ